MRALHLRVAAVVVVQLVNTGSAKGLTHDELGIARRIGSQDQSRAWIQRRAERRVGIQAYPEGKARSRTQTRVGQRVQRAYLKRSTVATRVVQERAPIVGTALFDLVVELSFTT